MVKQEPGGPYDQLHNFSKSVPPLVNFDEYNPTKNKATIDAFRTWIDNAVYAANISQDQAIRKALNALIGIAHSAWDSLTLEYKEDLIATGVNVVCEALYRMFVGQHDNEQREAYKRFKENRICDMRYFDAYCSEQYTNFYQSGQTNNNVQMYNTFLEGFPIHLQSFY